MVSRVKLIHMPPPVAMTLIQSDPARICSRVALRTASGPSATPLSRSSASARSALEEAVLIARDGRRGARTQPLGQLQVLGKIWEP